MDATHLLQSDSLTFAPDDLERRSLTAERVYHDYAPRVYSVARRMVASDLVIAGIPGVRSAVESVMVS